MERVVLHLDMDAFYAAVEIRDDPTLAGCPLIVGHRGSRGVVSTCSYEARRFGVHSAMASVLAERLCPGATWLPVRMDRYVEASRAIRRILDRVSPNIEPLSIDEAFIDLTGIACDLGVGHAVALALKQTIRQELRLTASVGVAPNKFLAKLASDLEKPDGLCVLGLDRVESTLWPLTVDRLWGVGPVTARRLNEVGLPTIGDIARTSRSTLTALVGASKASHLLELAHGRDERPVDGSGAAKSISEERTYARDLLDPEAIDRALIERVDGVARELRREALVARTVQLKARTGNFETWTRSLTLREATDLAEPILDAARRLLAERIDTHGRGLRLIGVGVTGLSRRGSGQAALFDDPRAERAGRLARAADRVCERIGDNALRRARMIERPENSSHDDPARGR